MSFDIPIKIDPGNSVATAKQVEQSLENLEKQGDQTNRALGHEMKRAANEGAAGLGTLQRQLEAEKRALQQTSTLAKHSAESTRILGERIREVGKTVAFNLAAENFSKLTEQIDGTAAAAANAAVQGAAVGATFGGPFGAVLETGPSDRVPIG